MPVAVNLLTPSADQILAVEGITLGVAAAGIRKANRNDLLLISLVQGSRVAGVFTQNRFCAAPVQVAREHLRRGAEIRALLVNTGNANAGTGEQGLLHARQTCDELARVISIAPEQVLPFSTGVIMEPLPVQRIVAGLPACAANLGVNHWLPAAQAIMTTDTVPKAASKRIKIGSETVTITGIAKGAGMIHPNMATMLGFIATDAKLSPALLEAALRHAADCSFNAITVDGDTSTNDALMLISTGRSRAGKIADPASNEFGKFRETLTEVAQALAQAIVRDGEGATKFITVQVEGGTTSEECRKVAFAIAHSPLVKTAFFASDPNLGRILAAIGYAGVADLDVNRVDVFLDDVLVARGGARFAGYTETDGQKVMQQSEITIRVVLARGAVGATVWTCDLSHDYVTINAEYRT